ncbi:MAG: hypothetical protein GY856_38135 [bacterium]|nr:hypothetical protein [bacterium]
MSSDRPIWYSPVPPGFFSRGENRRAFVEWLEKRLDIRKPEDWYVLTRPMVRDLGGAGVLRWYRNSIIAMLEDYAPPYDWKEWLFPRVGGRFWKDPMNCREYLEWLGEQLGYETPEDWYQLKSADVIANRGRTVMIPFKSSPCRLVMAYFPKHQWLEWRFHYTPNHFWDDPSNRRRYLDWLGEQLGYKKPEDWYRIKGDDLIDHYGNSLLKRYHGNPGHVVMANFPESEWLEWYFVPLPHAFWESMANRRRYLDWLGKKLGFQEMEDWYRVQTQDFREHRGALLLAKCGKTPSAVLRAIYVEHDWKEWLFDRIASHFWDDPADCDRYLDWLGEQLGFEEPQDWYQLTASHLIEHHGLTFIRKFEWKVAEVVRLHFPEYDWLEWLFDKVPIGFWADSHNRRRYMDWLGEQLGFKKPRDWYKLTKEDFYNHDGGALLAQFRSSPTMALKDYMPDYDWKEWLFSQTPRGFWKKRSNRRRYIRWLGEQVGCNRPEDWLRLRWKDFADNKGLGLIMLFRYSIDDILRDAVGDIQSPPARGPDPAPGPPPKSPGRR